MSSKTFRKSDGGGMCGSSWRDRGLLIARALECRDWEKPKDIILARHMADSGATVDEISAALGWNVKPDTAKRRLLKYRIRPFNPKHGKGAHRGQKAYLPPKTSVTFEVYRPKVVTR